MGRITVGDLFRDNKELTHSFIGFLPQLKSIDASDARLNKAPWITKTTLGFVNLENNFLTTLPSLKDHLNLKTLSVSFNPLSNYRFLEGNKSLKNFGAIGNAVANKTFSCPSGLDCLLIEENISGIQDCTDGKKVLDEWLIKPCMAFLRRSLLNHEPNSARVIEQLEGFFSKTCEEQKRLQKEELTKKDKLHRYMMNQLMGKEVPKSCKELEFIKNEKIRAGLVSN